MILSIFLVLLSMVIIWRASDGFEDASEYIGRNLTDGVRGATINAIGSSMPELFTTFIGLVMMQNSDGFAFGIGTTAGSAIFNAMIIPAVVIIAVILKKMTTEIVVSRKVILRDGISLIVAEFILIFLVSGNNLYWWHGAILMATYFAYVILLFQTMSKEDNSDDDEEEDEEEEGKDDLPGILQSIFTLDLSNVFIRGKINSVNSWVLLVASMIVIGLSCYVLVDSCEAIAGDLGIAPYFIAVVLASAATSVPDTIISVRDAFDGDYDDAVSNALGSNIFDICFALGFPLFIYTLYFGGIEMNDETLSHISELRGMLLGLTILTFLVFLLNKSLKLIHAVLLLLFYLIFTVYVVSRAYSMEWSQPIAEFFHNLFLR